MQTSPELSSSIQVTFLLNSKLRVGFKDFLGHWNTGGG
ncbi:hypothetical protein T4A_7427 [Trichinella pseudospiralis]|uniref:Uncharacterized protein n=1 Tax=Trichinella pseudospiralis TaxID=6337 RepID=A0A0V1DJD3_TRIPS|nr:hypothetical protein T4A_7427 [Trichinella pseudospiralis]